MKICLGSGEDNTTGCLLDYSYFKDRYKLIAIDLTRQKELDGDPKSIQKLVFKREVTANVKIFYVIEQAKKTELLLSDGITNVM